VPPRWPDGADCEPTHNKPLARASAWAIQTTPDSQGGTANNLSGVSCMTATSCVAVGDYVNASGTDVTLAESYSG
jgi:hypothetical protein